MASLSSPPNTGASAPQSVEKITRLAQDYKFNPSVPLRYWLRTAATLVREVCGLFPLSPPLFLIKTHANW